MLFEKCMSHMKPIVRTKAADCLCLFFEVTEAFEDSEETILEAVKSKNIKVGFNPLPMFINTFSLDCYIRIGCSKHIAFKLWSKKS